jgi:hypothetical protein
MNAVIEVDHLTHSYGQRLAVDNLTFPLMFSTIIASESFAGERERKTLKVQTFRAAYQTSASTVLLVLALVAGQISGVLYLSVGVGMLVGLFVWLVDGVLVYFAIRSFNRSRLLVNLA